MIVLIVSGLLVGYQVVQSQYYVGSNGGKVAIFRGMNDKFLGFKLYSAFESTNIPVAGIPVASAQEVARADTGSKTMARQLLANIRNQYNTCQAAEAKLHLWQITKPALIKIIKKGKNGKPITTTKLGRRAPKPVVPSFCPPPARGAAGK
jgi:hypothetical protein